MQRVSLLTIRTTELITVVVRNRPFRIRWYQAELSGHCTKYSRMRRMCNMSIAKADKQPRHTQTNGRELCNSIINYTSFALWRASHAMLMLMACCVHAMHMVHQSTARHDNFGTPNVGSTSSIFCRNNCISNMNEACNARLRGTTHTRYAT